MSFGIPSVYTPELAEAICARLSAGQSLKSICRDPGMPPFSTVQGWARTDHYQFTALYHCARKLHAQTFADELNRHPILGNGRCLKTACDFQATVPPSLRLGGSPLHDPCAVAWLVRSGARHWINAAAPPRGWLGDARLRLAVCCRSGCHSVTRQLPRATSASAETIQYPIVLMEY